MERVAGEVQECSGPGKKSEETRWGLRRWTRYDDRPSCRRGVGCEGIQGLGAITRTAFTSEGCSCGSSWNSASSKQIEIGLGEVWAVRRSGSSTKEMNGEIARISYFSSYNRLLM